MNPRTALALLSGLLLAACGGSPTTPKPRFVRLPDAPWARVTQTQIDAAQAMGVPVALVEGDRRFVYIPAGTYEREVEGARYQVNLGVGYHLQVEPDASGLSRAAIEKLTARLSADAPDGTVYRLPTEAEWAHAQRFLPPGQAVPEWMLDHDGPLPTWTVSDPHGPREGETYVVRSGPERRALPADTPETIAYRLVRPLGYGLGRYGTTEVTFRLVDEFAAKDAAPIPGGYDLRVISMNDRLQARTLGIETHWVRVPDPGSPVTLTMVPGAYYVYAERTSQKGLLRGKEMKFYVKDVPVERLVPIPERDQKRYGSGGREKPQ